MLNDLSSDEYRDWQRFATHEPIGYQRSDYQTALLAHITANQNLGKGKKLITIADMMPFDQVEKPKIDTKTLSNSIISNFAQYDKG